MKRNVIGTAVAVMCAIGVASAAVIFDPATGAGFVGKGDVQLTYGWNNKALQQNASSVKFQTSSTTVDESSWDCLNLKNEKIQERERTETTTAHGVVTTVARDGKNQITGFNLTGYAGGGLVTNLVTEGPKLNSCPDKWILVDGSQETVSTTTGGGLTVSTDGINWTPISNPIQ